METKHGGGHEGSGNRTSGSVNDEQLDFNPGLENRQLSDSDFSYEYDDQGRLTQKAAKDSSYSVDYTWDHRGLLLKAERTGAGAVTVEYGYDVSGRRTARRVTVGGSITEEAVTHYDGQNRIAEFDGSDKIVRHYLYGTGPNEVLAVDQGGATAWAFADQLGSVTTWGQKTGQV